MADEKRTDDKRADDKRADDKKNGGAKSAPEDLTPTPTQAENDEFKAKLFGTTVEKDKRAAKDAAEPLPPTPTQAENDAAKLAAVYVPEGAGDPQKAESQTHRRHVEAGRPGGYQTRASEAAPAKAE